MTGSNDTALYDHLVAEYNHHFDYWDWSYLEGRRVDVSTGPKPWDYTEVVHAALKQVRSALDMRTGSGQLFADMLKRQSVPEAYATEGYAPNLVMARQLLEPLGATVYEVDDIRKSLTSRQKSSRLEGSRTLVQQGRASGWGKPHAPPNCSWTWASATREEPIARNEPLWRLLARC